MCYVMHHEPIVILKNKIHFLKIISESAFSFGEYCYVITTNYRASNWGGLVIHELKLECGR